MNTETEKPRRRIGPLKGGLIVLAALTVLVLLLIVFRPKERPGPPGEKPVPVRVLRIEPRVLPDTIALPGRIEPRTDARLGAEKAGRVVELNAERGDRVEKDQVLLRVEDRSWGAILRQAEVEYREAEKELGRWRELKNAGAVAVSEFDAVQMRFDHAEASLAQARVNFAQCEVRSPFAGLVDDRFIEPGEYANEGAAVFRVVDIDVVKLLVDLPEQDAFAVKPGDLLAFTVASVPGRAFTGEVSFVAFVASRESNSFRIEAMVPNADYALKGGMIADVAVVRSVRDDALVVPLASVLPKKGEHIVFVVDQGRAVRRVVKIDAIVGDEAVLASGVHPGEDLVIEGQRVLMDGALVQVTE